MNVSRLVVFLSIFVSVVSFGFEGDDHIRTLEVDLMAGTVYRPVAGRIWYPSLHKGAVAKKNPLHAVLLFHDFGSSSEELMPIVRKLVSSSKKKFIVLALDYPLHGQSRMEFNKKAKEERRKEKKELADFSEKEAERLWGRYTLNWERFFNAVTTDFDQLDKKERVVGIPKLFSDGVRTNWVGVIGIGAGAATAAKVMDRIGIGAGAASLVNPVKDWFYFNIDEWLKNTDSIWSIDAQILVKKEDKDYRRLLSEAVVREEATNGELQKAFAVSFVKNSKDKKEEIDLAKAFASAAKFVTTKYSSYKKKK